MRWLCIYIYIYIHWILYISKYHGCSMSPDTTIFKHNKAIIKGEVHPEFPMYGRGWGLSGQNLDRWKPADPQRPDTAFFSFVPLKDLQVHWVGHWIGIFGSKGWGVLVPDDVMIFFGLVPVVFLFNCFNCIVAIGSMYGICLPTVGWCLMDFM